MSPSYGEPDADAAARLIADDRPVWMVNLLRYKDVATYPACSGEPPVSGREADERYIPYDLLPSVGGEIVFDGDVTDQLLGSGAPWQRVLVVRYPSGHAFGSLLGREDFAARHVHKDAGVASTIVLGCRPATGDLAAPTAASAGATLPDWADVPHPPTPEDGPVMVIHVTRNASVEGRAAMSRYSSKARDVAVPHGVQIAGWFDVDGTIMGDGRAWDQVRFNRFPSKAAFMAVVFDPDRLAAQADHREPALADTYTLIVRASVDAL
jgi:hypothetical protein